MCGIVGLLGERIDRELGDRMCDELTHRGPDSRGVWRKEDVWLAHRRLAVLDVSPTGHQPMQSSCGRYVLTYNGEVYNYLSLKEDLEKKGCRFRGTSDTEVVLTACIVWGIESALKRFEGMFAFGLYDCAQRMLWLARDPMGIKPLYYAASGNNIVFSSELTPLLQVPWIERTIHREGLYKYFQHLYVPAPHSIIEGVKKLSSGTFLRFNRGDITVNSYWQSAGYSLGPKGKAGQKTLEEAADELERRLRRSVRQHMRADVAYGAFLSGGIDSSTVVAMMQAESSRPVRTFSIGFHEKSHDESGWAAAVAKHLGTDHHELKLDFRQVYDLVPKVAGFFDEPFADNSAIPTYLLAKFAREKVTVCLSGDGGDELFGGYPRYFWANRIGRWRKYMKPAGAGALATLLRTLPVQLWDKVVDPVFGYRYSGSGGLAERVNRFANYLARDWQCKEDIMAGWIKPQNLLGYSPEEFIETLDTKNNHDLSPGEQMMLFDQENYLQDDILTKLDRASMAVSLEARVPLLSHPLVEWSRELNPEYKLIESGDRGKPLLREVLRRYVPEKLTDRPKMGFGMPMADWLRGPLKDWAASLLVSADLESCGLHAKIVEKVWQEHQSGVDRQAMIWSVLMYRQWYKKVIG